MSDKKITVLVTGATGNQGSAVAQHLLTSGKVAVRCLVRDTSSHKALALKDDGVELFLGNFDDVDSLRKAFKGCHAVYLNTMPGLNSIEVQHTRNVLSAAEDEGVKQVVCSTVCRAGEHQDFTILQENPEHFMLQYWKDKKAMQELVQKFGHDDHEVSWTILQPAWLMSNFIMPGAAAYWSERLRTDGVIETAFASDTQVQLTSGDDIGACATAAILAFFQDTEMKESYDRKVVRLAGDVLTVDEIATAMSEVSGRQISVEYLSQDRIRDELPRNPFIFSQQWAKVDGTHVDMEKMKHLALDTFDFKSFLEKNIEALKQAVNA